jgi:hypothetical protein
VVNLHSWGRLFPALLKPFSLKAKLSQEKVSIYQFETQSFRGKKLDRNFFDGGFI